MGIHKKIESPEVMWEHFKSYKHELEQNPIMIVEQKKGNTIIPKDYEGDSIEGPSTDIGWRDTLLYAKSTV